MIQGLENGASEYLAKPLDLDLLIVRLANLLERARSAAPVGGDTLRWGPLLVAPDEHSVQVDGEPVALTAKEFRLLLAFLRQPNRVLARSWLLQTVWGSSPDVATRTVDKHVETLRKKIPVIAGRIETVVKLGYQFRP